MGSGSALPPASELYARYARTLLRRIRRFYGPTEAPDVLQEVFERVLVAGHTFRGESSVVTWLYALTTRHCLIRLRNQRRRDELLAEGAPDWSLPIGPADPEVATYLRALWRTLDEELALIGLYYHVDGLSQAEIGALLGVSGRTVSTRLATLQQHARAAAAAPEER